MDTLRRIRPKESIVEYADRSIADKNDIPFLLIAIKNRNGNIVIVKNHSDEIMAAALKEIDAEDTGHVFFASELSINPLDNVMVPPHRLATSDELDYLQELNKPLPVLLMTDPIRRWYDFSKNSVVAIDRNDGNTYFRVVQ